MKEAARNMYNFIVVGNQKAIAAFVVTLIGGLGLSVGGTNLIDVTIGELISSVVTAVVATGAVWLKANKK